MLPLPAEVPLDGQVPLGSSLVLYLVFSATTGVVQLYLLVALSQAIAWVHWSGILEECAHDRLVSPAHD